MSTIERLTRRPDFLAAAEGRRFHTDRVTAQGRLRPSPADDAPDGLAPGGLRLGLTVTKRVGHATERNRIRRRLRAALAAIAPDLPERPADVVLVARRPCLTADFETLKGDLLAAIPPVTRPGGGKRSRPRGPAAPGGGDAARTPSRTTPGGPAAASATTTLVTTSATSNVRGGAIDGQ